ncbi:Aste57867_9896 [Aphanomyces stellatus]|uniref:Aste57867_9896 protein n=1 Tax=Aphanomyces stellatus TaxID=120398 RepID=A0A485KP01_9STRA|nr:hypothetical protein As57867_009857 [Aphanomyces stellatus]VFT86775.1 Aste57867_9896 [Aphanomyces stellatus]
MASWQTHGNYPEPFHSWVKTYGGVVRVRQLFSYALILADPKAIQHVFLTHADNYPQDPMINLITAVRMACMSFSINDKFPGPYSWRQCLECRRALHAKYRKLFAPYFTPTRIKSFLDMFKAQAHVTCERLLLATGSHDHATLEQPAKDFWT